MRGRLDPTRRSRHARLPAAPSTSCSPSPTRRRPPAPCNWVVDNPDQISPECVQALLRLSLNSSWSRREQDRDWTHDGRRSRAQAVHRLHPQPGDACHPGAASRCWRRSTGSTGTSTRRRSSPGSAPRARRSPAPPSTATSSCWSSAGWCSASASAATASCTSTSTPARTTTTSACRDCGRVVEFVSPSIQAMLNEICRAHGFSREARQIQIFGLCAGVRRGGAPTKPRTIPPNPRPCAPPPASRPSPPRPRESPSEAPFPCSSP